jgi:hypothetical protein
VSNISLEKHVDQIYLSSTYSLPSRYFSILIQIKGGCNDLIDSNTKEPSSVAKEDKAIPEISDIISIEIQDIEGIGLTTTKKLKEAGIVSVMDLAVTSADELAVDINASKESAATTLLPDLYQLEE